jgi:hypothetical protein
MRGNINLVMGNETKNRWSSNQEQDAIKQNPYPGDTGQHWSH